MGFERITHMTKLLCRLFIRGGDACDARTRASYGTLSGVTGIVLNLLLFSFKFTVGFLTASLAIQADAFNNLTDAGSSIVSLVSFRMASKPADRDHPFGHARIEYLASVLVACLILLIGFELLTASIGGIISPVLPVFHLVAVIVLSVSVLCKLWLFLFNRALGKKIDSSVLRATAIDSLSDALSTLAVLVSQLAYYFFGFNIDAYVGVVVAVMICIAGLRVLMETKNSILGEAPVQATVDEIKRIVSEYPEVLGIHDLLVHSYGATHSFASFHAEVDGEKDVFVTHDVIDCIERRIESELSIACTIHLDPIVTSDERVSALRARVSEIVVGVNPALSIHDFRFVEGTTHTNLIFDLVIPFELRAHKKSLLETVELRIKEENPCYFAVIQTDFA